MSLLMRWFSADYRAGLGAEAAGDLVEAARRFGACGRHGDLARVLRLQVADCTDRRAAVEIARRAVQAAERAEEDLTATRACLAEALSQLADLRGPDWIELQREFAALCLSLDWCGRAGVALEAVGDHELAADAYAKAGDIPAMNRALAAFKAAGLAAVGQTGLAAKVEALLGAGRGDEAWDLVAGDAPTRREVEDRLSVAHLVVLRGAGGCVRLCSQATVEIGREEGLPLSVRVPSVSRRHVKLTVVDGGLVVTDLGSAAGTLHGTLYLKEPLKVARSGRVSLGTRCELRFESEDGAWRVQAHADGVESDVLYLGRYIEFDGRPWVADGRWWRVEGRVPLVGEVFGDWTVER